MLIPIALKTNTTPYSIIFRAFCVLIMFILLFSANINRYSKKKFSTLLLAVIFWIILLVRIIYDFEFTNVLKQNYIYLNPAQVYLFSIFLSFLPIIIIYKNRHFINLRIIENNLLNISLLYGISIIIGLYLNFGLDFGKIFFERTELVYGSEFGPHPLNPISIGRAGSIILVLILNEVFNKNKFNLIKFLISIILSLSLLFLGSSRGPFLSTIIIILILLFTYRDRYSLTKLIIAIIFVVFLILYFIDFRDLGLFKRFENPIYGDDPTRVEIWTAAIDYFLKNPVFGYSIVDKYGIYPHNIYLESLMATGIIGSIPFFILLKRLFYKIRMEINLKRISGISVIMILYLLFSFSSGSLYFTPELWVILSIKLFCHEN